MNYIVDKNGKELNGKIKSQKEKLDIQKYDCSIDNDSYSRSDG